ncbi:MAG: dihydrodipicolinate reductase [Planctomycetes bacterium]|nr:dihydrodipicolinate reductase [Planctomycetota bacterium]
MAEARSDLAQFLSHPTVGVRARKSASMSLLIAGEPMIEDNMRYTGDRRSVSSRHLPLSAAQNDLESRPSPYGPIQSGGTSMKSRPRVLQVGLGPIGRDTARRAAARGYEVVGAVDIDPSMGGQSLSEILETDIPGEVVGSVEDALEAFAMDAALVTTVSDLDKVVPDCETLLQGGVAVISTCEEMAYPLHTQPDATGRLDEAAKAGGVACLGTGINPGFVLDLLPALVSAPLDRVETVRAWRVVDAGTRRGPLQKKVGAGLTEEEFHARVKGGSFGHRGFMESLHMVCDAFDVDPRGATTFIRPVICDADIDTGVVKVKAGQVAGIHQGAEDREGKVVLDLKMYVGAKEPGDRVELAGDPPIKVQVEGGYMGDVATCAIALNAVPAVLRAAPGFRTMLDLPALPAPRG